VTRKGAHDAAVIDPGATSVQPAAPHAALMTHRISDPDRWKAGWDDHESERRDAGFSGHLILRSQTEPDVVSVLLPVADLTRARMFASSRERITELARYGVRGRAKLHWLELLRSDLVWDRRLSAGLATTRVGDVGAWLAADDAAAGQRRATGVIGHAVARHLDDPHLTVVLDQAERFEVLREAVAAPAPIGAVAPPTSDVRFLTSGWGTTYPPTTSTPTDADTVRRRH